MFFIRDSHICLQEKKAHIYTLQPLSDKRWEGLKHDLSKKESNTDRKETLEAIDTSADTIGVSRSEANSLHDLTTQAMNDSLEHGVILDAGREVRIKLYMGQVNPLFQCP